MWFNVLRREIISLNLFVNLLCDQCTIWEVISALTIKMKNTLWFFWTNIDSYCSINHGSTKKVHSDVDHCCYQPIYPHSYSYIITLKCY